MSVIRQTGRLEASNFCTIGGSVPGGRRFRSAIARLEISVTSESAFVPGWKKTLMMLVPGQRTRFHVVDARAEREEALETTGDVGLDLLGRHAAVEGGDHDLRNVDVGKEVHRHAHHAGDADHRHDQTDDDDEVRVADGKARH